MARFVFALFLLIPSLINAQQCNKHELHKFHETGGVQKTSGSVWPQPQTQKSTDDFFILLPKLFSFSSIGQKCDILDDAYKRYYVLIFDPPRMKKFDENAHKTYLNNTGNTFGVFTTLQVDLQTPCGPESWPNDGMNEEYQLKIVPKGKVGIGTLTAKSIWGVLRGLETFSQLVYRFEDAMLVVNGTSISDYPRFSFRGIMIDTARHYLPKKLIMDTIETMAQNKFNVLHWHIVDDQAFPFVSQSFPALSEKGAYNRYTHVYARDDIVDVIMFARLRGIRVIPEFDTPGHTQSWGLGIPGLLTQCYKNESGNLIPNGFGPIDPSVESSFTFLKTFFTEVLHYSLADNFIHLGGDEVSFDCWKSNPQITAFMQKKGFGANYTKLEEYYMQRLLDVMNSIEGRKQSYIIWQEVIDNGVQVKPDTIVEVWKQPYKSELANVTKKGYRTLLSACWYLNYITYGSDWQAFYLCDPQDFNGTAAQKKLVFGGEACIWGEYVDATNLTPRLWPRASAVAERLWSAQTVNNTNTAIPRLEEHRCRMLIRGIDAEPVNGPSYCSVDYRA